jgi:hypothetical protein
MNWLIWEEIFTYFYNKIRPVNCTHYMKFSVNISTHNSGCCRSSVVPWFTVFSWHTDFTKSVIYKFTFLWFSAKQDTTNRPTSLLAHLYTMPFLWPREEHRWQRSWVDCFVGQCLLWRLSIRKIYFASALGLPVNLGMGRSWIFPASSVTFLNKRRLKFRWVIFSPTWR